MKRIAILSGNRVAPATTGGQVHSLSMARALARLGYEVQILSIAGRREDYRLATLLSARTVTKVIEPRLVERTYLNAFTGVVQSVVRRLDYPRVWQPAFLKRGWLPRDLKRKLLEADLIISDSPYCPPVPGPWRSKPWFLISHNLEHKLLEQGSARQQRFAGLVYELERIAPQTYTDIFACAEEDQAFFKDHDSTAELMVPIVRCGVDPQAYVWTAAVRRETRASLRLDDADTVLVFSASGFGPNVEAFESIKRFCHQESEFLGQKRVHMLVVGTVATSPFRDGPLIVTGRVDEILPYLACADAGVNLVTRGSGSNVKLFEYLAAKLPVISTAFGVRGTELEPDRDYLQCAISTLKTTIERFLQRSKTDWGTHAEAVWNRHSHSCDIQWLVKDAIVNVPAFS